MVPDDIVVHLVSRTEDHICVMFVTLEKLYCNLILIFHSPFNFLAKRKRRSGTVPSPIEVNPMSV